MLGRISLFTLLVFLCENDHESQHLYTTANFIMFEMFAAFVGSANQPLVGAVNLQMVLCACD